MDNKPTPPNTGQSSRRLGDILRETRISKGLELSDVAEVTHVRKEYLKALDEGRYQDLPEDVYARNFVRLYAQTLGIGDTQLLEKFKRERAAALEPDAGPANPAPTIGSAKVGVHPAPTASETASPQPTQGGAPAREAAAPARDPGARPGQPSAASRAQGERPRASARSAPSAPSVIPVTRRSARDQSPANLDRDFWNGDPSRRRGGPLLWLAALVVLALIGAGIWWAVSGRTSSTATPPATGTATAPVTPSDASGPAIIPLEPSAEGAATSEAPPPSSVTLSVTSTPPGAEVSVDNFYLGNTPLQFPIRARESGVIRLTLDGYQTAEFSESLSSNRTFNVDLRAAGEEAPAGASSPAEATASEGNLVITVEAGASWLEVWGGGGRNEGERLLYTTAQPGQRFEFPLPVYVHAGAASNIRVSVDGETAGPLGSGEVVGRLFR